MQTFTAFLQHHSPLDSKPGGLANRWPSITKRQENTMAPRKETNVINENIKQEATVPLSEIGETPPIEPVAENDLVKKAELEAFMNQELLILVHESQEEDPLLTATPSVNGVNMPIVMGVETKVRRKYVEALARGRTTAYKQAIDPLDQSRYDMVPKTVMSFPFTVIHDPHPNGREWLKGIMAQQ